MLLNPHSLYWRMFTRYTQWLADQPRRRLLVEAIILGVAFVLVILSGEGNDIVYYAYRIGAITSFVLLPFLLATLGFLNIHVYNKK